MKYPDKKLLNYIREAVRRHYPNMKNGDCYKINSTVAYFLYGIGYDAEIIQGRVYLDKEIYDHVLEANNPETKGITALPDHIYIRISGMTNKWSDYFDFAKNVFLPSKILQYQKSRETLYGKENKKLYQDLKSNYCGKFVR